jgi:predicted dehydrogenase
MGKRHAENLRWRVPQAELIAVADADAARAKQVAAELGIEHSYPSLESMLERKDIHCVVISTPDKFHADAVRAAAAAGKDILCEKPTALDSQDARSALQAAADAGVRLQVGFMRRYDPAYVSAKKQIEAGDIGEPVIFKSIGRDRDAPPIGYYKSRLNGMLFFASSIHDFDLARWLMNDEVSEVQAYKTVAVRPELAQYDDIVAGVVNLRYQSGAIGNVESYAQCVYGYDVRTEVIGSKGSILVGTLRQTPATFLKSNGGTYELTDGFLTRFADAYLAEVRDFVDNMLNERNPRVTGEDGLRAVQIAVAAQKSSLTGISCPVDQSA